MKNLWKFVIIGAAVVLSAAVLGYAYTYKYRCQNTVTVTGLGETEFTSDFIVWGGSLHVESRDVISGYAKIESDRQKVLDYITSKGIDPSSVVFQFVNVYEQTEPVYNAQGNYAGSRFKCYSLNQSFTIESKDVDKVENISREISSLIAKGVSIDAQMPSYYYTGLDDVKLSLIEKASADALARANNILRNAGGRLGRVMSARLGVFQITGANTNEEFSAGGSFNTTNRNKKARVTIRVEYRVK